LHFLQIFPLLLYLRLKTTRAIACFAGFIAQMVQLSTNVILLHKSFKLALLPAKKAMVAVLYVSCI